MKGINSEIEQFWIGFQQMRQSHQPEIAALLLKATILYLHVQGLQSGVRLPDPENAQQPKVFDLEYETEKIWATIRLAEKYGTPGLVQDCFRESLKNLFYRSLEKTAGIWKAL